MEHWFDRLTKSLATGQLSRRNVLQGAAAVGGSWILSRAAIPAALASTQFRIKPLANPPTCEVERKGGEVVITYSARSSYRGQNLTLSGIQSRRGRRHATLQSEMRVDLDGKPVMDFHQSITPAIDAHARWTTPTVRTNVSYGDSIGGVRSVTAVAKGNQIQGFADSRAFTADRTPQAALRFKSPGSRQPAVRVDPGLADAIRQLFAAANRNLQTCSVRRASGPALHDVSRSDVVMKSRREMASSLAFSGVLASMMVQNIPSQGPCDDCLYACDKTFAACTGGVVAGGALTGGFGLFGEVGCYTDYSSCGDNCNKPGGPCCAVGCPGGGCCPQNTTCCGNTCCDSGSTTCATAKDAAGETVYDCCPSSAPNLQILGYQYSEQYVNETLEVVCCPNGTTGCSGDSCCSSDQYCANSFWGICCLKGQSLCAGACCDGTCVKTAAGTETCCPRTSVCGSNCCSTEERCLQSPGGPICCAIGGQLCGGQCCGPGAICHNGQCFYGSPCGNTHCGLVNPVCCNGVCCGSNQTCVNGRCTGPQCKSGEVPCPDTPGMCCPPNTGCCAAVKQCCAPGKECCGARGCIPSYLCTG